jgi:hypothetical protein
MSVKGVAVIAAILSGARWSMVANRSLAATRSAISRAILCAASAPVGSSAQVRMSTSMAAAVVSARRHRQPAPCWLVDAISIPGVVVDITYVARQARTSRWCTSSSFVRAPGPLAA